MEYAAATSTSVCRCAGKTRAEGTCRGHARYACTCGRRWCGMHVTRKRAELRCPACERTLTTP